MAKKKTIYTTTDEPAGRFHSGIEITYNPRINTIYISGWYDSFVGIEGREWSLADFIKELGISRKNIEKALDGTK